MDLYSDIILDHYKHPHHKGELKKYSHRAVEYNPLCGDTIQADILLNRAKRVQSVGFVCGGCAISQASMSLFSDWLIQKHLCDISDFSVDDMVKMLHVPISPSRMTCATLGVIAVKKALNI